AGGLVVKASTVLIAVAAGLSATLIAGVLPAVRASRVPPLAALRDVAAEPAIPSRLRAGIGAALLLGGAAGTTSAAVAGTAGLVAVAAVATVIGVVVFGPLPAPP